MLQNDRLIYMLLHNCTKTNVVVGVLKKIKIYAYITQVKEDKLSEIYFMLNFFLKIADGLIFRKFWNTYEL